MALDPLPTLGNSPVPASAAGRGGVAPRRWPACRPLVPNIEECENGYDSIYSEADQKGLRET